MKPTFQIRRLEFAGYRLTTTGYDEKGRNYVERWGFDAAQLRILLAAQFFS